MRELCWSLENGSSLQHAFLSLHPTNNSNLSRSNFLINCYLWFFHKICRIYSTPFVVTSSTILKNSNSQNFYKGASSEVNRVFIQEQMSLLCEWRQTDTRKPLKSCAANKQMKKLRQKSRRIWVQKISVSSDICQMDLDSTLRLKSEFVRFFISYFHPIFEKVSIT